MNIWIGEGVWAGWKATESELISPTGRSYRPDNIEPNRYNQADLAKILGVTRGAIQDRIKRGTLPEFDVVEGNKSYWSYGAIQHLIKKV